MSKNLIFFYKFHILKGLNNSGTIKVPNKKYEKTPFLKYLEDGMTFFDRIAIPNVKFPNKSILILKSTGNISFFLNSIYII